MPPLPSLEGLIPTSSLISAGKNTEKGLKHF